MTSADARTSNASEVTQTSRPRADIATIQRTDEIERADIGYRTPPGGTDRAYIYRE